MIKRIRYKKRKNDKDRYYHYILLVVISILIFLSILLIIKTRVKKLDIPIENISSFSILPENMIKIEEISIQNNIDFIEMLTYYLIENKFFDKKEKNIMEDDSSFFTSYPKIKLKYNKAQIEPYYTFIRNMIEEIEMFPIPKENIKDYIYGDTFGAERVYGGKRLHMGTDIMDRENIASRIPIISMTDGIIENIGWNEKGGYRVGIRSNNDNYYYYAHFDSFSEGIYKGQAIKAGDMLGYMGNTGYSKIEGTKGKFEVHLHMGIEIKMDTFSDRFWINPYPFLRYIEGKNSINNTNDDKLKDNINIDG